MPKSSSWLSLWLTLCIITIVGMVLLGGYTRLSGAGLSIVEWRPISGILPPLNTQEWQQEFTLYQQTPEFTHVNMDMTLSAFKGIFWVEYLHRLLGRLLGLVFFIPFIFFWIKGALAKSTIYSLLWVGLLGTLQGLMGWYMVKSGLIKDPFVSPLRLMGHFLLAVWILGLLLRTLLRIKGKTSLLAPHFRKYTVFVLTLLLITMAYGALVAGLKAGLIYNTFPLMNGEILPDDAWYYHPTWKNFLENPTMVQFMHRAFSLLTLASIGGLFYIGFRSPTLKPLRRALIATLFIALLQICLGITTLLLQVPLPFALTHQAGALFLFLAILYLALRTKKN